MRWFYIRVCIMFSDEYRVEYYTKNAAKYIDVRLDQDVGEIEQDTIIATNISSLIAFKKDESLIEKNPFWSETTYIDDIAKYFALVDDPSMAILPTRTLQVLSSASLIESSYSSLFESGVLRNVGFYALFGDSSKYADFESGVTIFSKVRPIGAETRNVILKLQCSRHYGMLPMIPEIDIPYEQKLPKLFWRGISTGCNFRHNMRDVAVTKFQRHSNDLRISSDCTRFAGTEFGDTPAFLRNPTGLFATQRPSGFSSNPNIDIKFNMLVQGISGEYVIGDWHDIKDQLQYKYLLSIEGNDVATNLKWIMLSNSVCIMPLPQICSWFMEDHLIPYVHFVPISDDFSDLEEVYEWCLDHDAECEEISKNATEFAKQFLDLEREDEITRKVIMRYFDYSAYEDHSTTFTDANL